jgi:F0F1-type ATP synthase membrane subunit a
MMLIAVVGVKSSCSFRTRELSTRYKGKQRVVEQGYENIRSVVNIVYHGGTSVMDGVLCGSNRHL